MKKSVFCLVMLAIWSLHGIGLFAQVEKNKQNVKTTTTVQVKPDTIKPAAEKPVTTKPNTIKPGTNKPVTKEPAIEQGKPVKPTTQTGNVPDPQRTIDPQQLINAGNPVVSSYENGNVNWTQQYVEATGYSVMDKAKYTIEGQAELMARQGAKVIAQRNLLEIVQGIRIVGETKVQDCVTKGDYVYTRIDGIIKGAEMVGDYVVKGNIVEVTMRVPLYQSPTGKGGIGDALLPTSKSLKVNPSPEPTPNINPNPEPTPTPVPNKETVTINPSLFPVVVDSCGSIIFDYRQYYDPSTGKIPQYIEVTQTVANLLGAGDKVDNVLQGVADAASGQIKIKGCSNDKNTGEKINKWVNIIGKVVDIGKWVVSLF